MPNPTACGAGPSRRLRHALCSALVTALALGLPAGLALAAEPVEPPSVEMTGAGKAVVVAELLAKPSALRLQLRIDEVVAGDEETGAQVELRGRDTDRSAFRELVAGRRYVVAFTRLASDDQFRDAKYIDPEGPRVLHLRGLPAPAVFDDAPALRFLFQRARGEEQQPTDRQRLDAILDLMQQPPLATRAFAIEELYLRDELRPVVGATDALIVRHAMARPGLPVQLVQFLFETAQQFSAGPAAPWLHGEAVRIVRSTGPKLLLTSAEPLLVKTAMRTISAAHDAHDLPAVLALLASNSPVIVRMALEAGDAMDTDATLAAVEARLEAILLETDVHPDALRALERYLVARSLPGADGDTDGDAG